MKDEEVDGGGVRVHSRIGEDRAEDCAKAQRSQKPGTFGKSEGSRSLKFKQPESKLISWEW